MSVLLYSCTTWTLTKRSENKVDGNFTKMLNALLKKCRKQHLTKRQLCDHLPLISQTILVRRKGHAGKAETNNEVNVLLWVLKHGNTSVGRTAKTYIHQLCVDTGFRREDQPIAMHDRGGWGRERERERERGDPCYHLT